MRGENETVFWKELHTRCVMKMKKGYHNILVNQEFAGEICNLFVLVFAAEQLFLQHSICYVEEIFRAFEKHHVGWMPQLPKLLPGP